MTVELDSNSLVIAFNIGVQANEHFTDLNLDCLATIHAGIENILTPVLSSDDKNLWRPILVKVAILGFIIPAILYPDKDWKRNTIDLIIKKFSTGEKIPHANTAH